MAKRMSKKAKKEHFWNLISLIPDGGCTCGEEENYIDDTDRDRLSEIYDLISKNPNYDKIYDIIAEVYKNVVDRYDGNANNRGLYKVPLTLRKVIYFVIYSRLAIEYGFDRNKLKVGRTDFQKDTLDEINKRLKAAGVPPIHKNTFNSDKWNMHPTKDFKEGVTYTAPKIPFYYDGMKKSILGYMISELVSQYDYKIFLDAFGGSGADLMCFESRKDTEEYINDFDPANCNFYYVMRDDINGFIKEYKNVITNIGKQLPNSNQTKDEAEVAYSKGLYSRYDNMIKSPSNIMGDINLAMAFYFTHFFAVNSHPSKSGINSDALEKFKNNYNFGNLQLYHNRIKNVEILNSNAINLLADVRFNRPETLCYLDSPYTATKGYNKSFTQNDMKDLLTNLSKFKGKFIFSCRAAIGKVKSLLKILEELEDSEDYDAYENHRKKIEDVNKKERVLAGFFEDFKNLMQEKDLYVLFQCGAELPFDPQFNEFKNELEEDILDKIENSKIFEIMITNFDFKVPDINRYMGSANFEFGKTRKKGFCKMRFEDFYNVVHPRLIKFNSNPSP